jgi:hypothetical protein
MNRTPEEDAMEELKRMEAEAKKNQMRELIEKYSFKCDKRPAKPIPIIILDGKPIATRGNLIAVAAGIKAGKTAGIGGILAAFFRHHGDDDSEHDTLGFTANNPNGLAVIHFDTEQSEYDHDNVIRRAMIRAGVTETPPWFKSVCVTGLNLNLLMPLLETLIDDMVAAHGGICAIILDGVADYVRSPNDETEAFALVENLHGKAREHACTLLGVIHTNPNSDKTRGHLGSQLARKAETCLQIEKDKATQVSTMWSDDARHGDIPKHKGVCFTWSDSALMHVTTENTGTTRPNSKSVKPRRYPEHITDILDSGDRMQSCVTKDLMDLWRCSRSTVDPELKSAFDIGQVFWYDQPSAVGGHPIRWLTLDPEKQQKKVQKSKRKK